MGDVLYDDRGPMEGHTYRVARPNFHFQFALDTRIKIKRIDSGMCRILVNFVDKGQYDSLGDYASWTTMKAALDDGAIVLDSWTEEEVGAVKTSSAPRLGDVYTVKSPVGWVGIGEGGSFKITTVDNEHRQFYIEDFTYCRGIDLRIDWRDMEAAIRDGLIALEFRLAEPEKPTGVSIATEEACDIAFENAPSPMDVVKVVKEHARKVVRAYVTGGPDDTKPITEVCEKVKSALRELTGRGSTLPAYSSLHDALRSVRALLDDGGGSIRRDAVLARKAGCSDFAVPWIVNAKDVDLVFDLAAFDAGVLDLIDLLPDGEWLARCER